MPPNTVYVGRPTKWGNPYNASWMSNRTKTNLYRKLFAEFIMPSRSPNGFRNMMNRVGAKESLRGKNLACWCPLDAECHADVLLEIANEE